MPTDPVLRPGESPAQPTAAPAPTPVAEECDYCGSTTLRWIKCKLICDNCHQINKSCADL